MLNYFIRYAVSNDKKLGLEDLKVMMEKLNVPQTHLGTHKNDNTLC